jgi:hypothetical protein
MPPAHLEHEARTERLPQEGLAAGGCSTASSSYDASMASTSPVSHAAENAASSADSTAGVSGSGDDAASGGGVAQPMATVTAIATARAATRCDLALVRLGCIRPVMAHAKPRIREGFAG